eukprot:CAMPEP_0197617540 /NCGR_PEP_ID=MMETSP1326-20131121/61088_1 /TAXON_ID=1155430 /ORGANISM="Genus nov. species nov., Strain RCC2288" /LENGTH=233 /DNA_ID=CAMNT_0043186435 /DNA_START=696 /DNA_END=1393 /DNA_ORIENTATION=+
MKESRACKTTNEYIQNEHVREPHHAQRVSSVELYHNLSRLGWFHVFLLQRRDLLQHPLRPELRHQHLQARQVRHVQVPHHALQRRGVAVDGEPALPLAAQPLGHAPVRRVAPPLHDPNLLLGEEAGVQQVPQHAVLRLRLDGPLALQVVVQRPRGRREEQAADVQLIHAVAQEREGHGGPLPRGLQVDVRGGHAGHAVRAVRLEDTRWVLYALDGVVLVEVHADSMVLTATPA